MGRSSPAMT